MIDNRHDNIINTLYKSKQTKVIYNMSCLSLYKTIKQVQHKKDLKDLTNKNDLI